jgi:hypothetical protein
MESTRIETTHGKMDVKIMRGPGIIIVEGLYDETLLNSLLQKLVDVPSMHELGFFTIYRTKQSQNDIIKDLAHNPYPIIVFRDIDKFTIELKELKECANFIEENTKLKCKIKQQTVLVSSGAEVKITTMGLIDDPDLNKIGIKIHSMEDYLLKLIAVDNAVSNWCGCSLKELRNLAIKRKKIHVDKSKTILSTLAMKKQMEYNDLIRVIIQLASFDNVLSITKGLLKHLLVF